MTTTTTTKPPLSPLLEWLIILPDRPGALAKRMEVRPKHLEGIKPRVEEGFCTFGGAILEEQPQGDEALKIKGSVMLAQAGSREEVLKNLKEDIYTQAGVWDWDKVEIYPFRSAVRTAM